MHCVAPIGNVVHITPPQVEQEIILPRAWPWSAMASILPSWCSAIRRESYKDTKSSRHIMHISATNSNSRPVSLIYFSYFRTFGRSYVCRSRMFHLPHHLICTLQSGYYLLAEAGSPHPASLEPPSIPSPFDLPISIHTYYLHESRIRNGPLKKKNGWMTQHPNIILILFSDKVYNLFGKIK